MTANRPPIYTLRLPEVVVDGAEPCFDRAGTEADFMLPATEERHAGMVRAVHDQRLIINVGKKYFLM